MESKNILGKTLKRMLKNVTRQNKKIYYSTAFYTILAGVYPFFAVLLPKILISVLQLDSDQAPMFVVLVAIGYFVLAGGFGFFLTFLRDRTYPLINLLRLDYLCDIFEKLITIAYPYREDSTFYEKYQMAFRANASNNNGVEGIYHKLYILPAEVLSILILTILIAIRSPLIVLSLVISILVGLFVKKKTNQFEYKKKEEKSKAGRRRDYYYRTTYDFAYGKDLRIFGFQNRVLENYNAEIKRYVAVIRMIKNKEFSLGFLELAAILVRDIVTYGLLIFYVLNGMSIANFSMYLTAVISLSAILHTFSEDISFIYRESLYVNDFYRLMDEDLGVTGGKRKAIEGETLEIEFKNVTFRYPNTDKDIFKNLNFTIHKGEKLAIVGINGAGKSTLVKLMTGLFEPTEGEILVNHIPISEFNRQEYFKMFSVVFQDITTLAFSIAENVACSAANQIDRKRVENCLQRVGLHEKVKGLEKGLDQMMLKVIDENGVQFSGGESQKLSIARALYKDSNMVILDEPTAALDALAEASIYENFSDLVTGKTAVYISHRLASTKFCDKIALFDQEGLREYGNHEELMKKKGEYYKMFTIQGKYYREGESR